MSSKELFGSLVGTSRSLGDASPRLSAKAEQPGGVLGDGVASIGLIRTVVLYHVFV